MPIADSHVANPGYSPKKREFDVVITDFRLPGMGGMELLENLQNAKPRMPVVMMTSYGNSDTVIGATKRGAFEYLMKPFDMKELIDVVAKAVTSSRLMFKPVAMGTAKAGTTAIIGTSQGMRNVFKEIGRVAPTDASVLIRGETGTGKELIARAIYQHSERSNEAFVAVNCGAIPETLLESELFGHRKGAFTGADMNRIGRLQQADGGTLFLDEIGDMPLSTQVKLLRALQERTIQPLGASEDVKVDVRILAATHQNLEQYIAAGKFREDLFYRLNSVVIHVPPLRERQRDLAELASFFLSKASADFKVEAAPFDNPVLKRLAAVEWPGNVRQLENVVARAVLQAKGRVVTVEDIDGILEESGSSRILQDSDDIEAALRSWVRGVLKKVQKSGENDGHARLISVLETTMISEALKLKNGHQGNVAELLGISRVTLRQRIKALGIGGADDA
ncbi:MAG: sigma-54 dependent transcriptional regulator [Verrucomicrobia bacterium]|nr:sigma-54 dependent transcriptional regulator [Verrucomicrobiota bacterium]